jgi:hypothetical protein
MRQLFFLCKFSACVIWQVSVGWTPYPFTKLTAAFRIFFFTPELKKMGYSVNFTCDSLTVA